MSRIEEFLEAIGQEPSPEQARKFEMAVLEVISSNSDEVGRAASRGFTNSNRQGGG
ncbi:hypothetical protein [Microbacterium sp.]|uniref:hypothetical protein n=1 Tax=Microbacterium sp. TaxID=51671 RepID=UPI002C0A6096|nr:hypothetical protein [Microbacterium sp.]HWL78115.1 hypothetical protein [Microbacterium sp.]